jgi:hypothetical protein
MPGTTTPRSSAIWQVASGRRIAIGIADIRPDTPCIKGGAIIDHETPRERRIVAVEK